MKCIWQTLLSFNHYVPWHLTQCFRHKEPTNLLYILDDLTKHLFCQRTWFFSLSVTSLLLCCKTSWVSQISYFMRLSREGTSVEERRRSLLLSTVLGTVVSQRDKESLEREQTPDAQPAKVLQFKAFLSSPIRKT